MASTILLGSFGHQGNRNAFRSEEAGSGMHTPGPELELYVWYSDKIRKWLYLSSYDICRPESWKSSIVVRQLS